MNAVTISKARGTIGLGAIAVLLAACGGGGGGGVDGGGGPCSGGGDAGMVRLECHVRDAASGKDVAEATVTYQGKLKLYTTQTKPNGDCRFDLPAEELAGVKFPAASATKPGYEPQTIIYPAMKAKDVCEIDVSMKPLARNMSIPVGGDTVWHLGDEQFEGSTNSQFQKPTDGAELVFPIADWADQVKVPGVTKATVFLDAKGWESDVCKNQIALVGDVGTQSLKGGTSPPEGYWAGGTNVPFVFDIAQVGLQRAELKITAGECRGTVDLDDFEINRIRVMFN